MGGEDLYRSVAEAHLPDPRVTESKMFGAPGLKVSGKVFAVLWRDSLVVKLSRERVDELVAAGAAERFDPGMGRVMKEWVSVGPGGPAGWPGLAQEAKDFVFSRL